MKYPLHLAKGYCLYLCNEYFTGSRLKYHYGCLHSFQQKWTNIIFLVLVIQGSSLLLLLAGFVVMILNLSDKEIRESVNRNYYIIDYFRSPQKYLFLISICGSILSVIAQGISSSVFLSKCIKSENKINKYLDSIGSRQKIHEIEEFRYYCPNEYVKCYFYFNCINFNVATCNYINSSSEYDCTKFGSHYYYYKINKTIYTYYDCYKYDKNLPVEDPKCSNSSVFLKILISCGCLQLLIVMILFAVSKLFWSGECFRRILEIPFLKYISFIFAFAFYPFLFIMDIFVYIINDFDTGFKITNYRAENNFTLSFAIIQIISFIIFLVALSFLRINKSDKEIIENDTELIQPFYKN